MHAEGWFAFTNWSDEKFGDLFHHAIASSNAFARVFVDETDYPVGFFMGMWAEHFWGTDTYATDIGLYILPAFRGSSIFVRTIKEFEAWAKEQGCAEVVLGVSVGIDDEKVNQLYNRLGFDKASTAWRKKCIAA